MSAIGRTGQLATSEAISEQTARALVAIFVLSGAGVAPLLGSTFELASSAPRASLLLPFRLNRDLIGRLLAGLRLLLHASYQGAHAAPARSRRGLRTCSRHQRLTKRPQPSMARTQRLNGKLTCPGSTSACPTPRDVGHHQIDDQKWQVMAKPSANAASTR